MIVILGAFGRTGRVTAALLQSAGRTVRRVTRSSAAAPGTLGHEVVQARLADEAALGRALSGAHAVYALLPDDLRAESFRAERRAMAEAMAKAIERERVPRVVLLSSAAAALGEEGHNGLGADLAYFERLIWNTPAVVSVLRASYFQDNLLEALPGATRDGIYPNFFASREHAIPTIATVDVGRIAAQLLLEPSPKQSEILDLIGPRYSPEEMASILGEVLGRALKIVDVPSAQLAQMFRQWMSVEAAGAVAETFACLGSGRVLPQGKRTLYGQTRLEQVLRSALIRSAEAGGQVQP